MASSSSSSSSSHNNIITMPPPHHLLNHYNAPTSAPPPTPSTQPTHPTSTNATSDALTRLLHRLPPTLSFPGHHRLSPRATAATTTRASPLPTISLSSSPDLSTSSFQLGYFQLSPHDHPITSQLAESAESDSVSLFDLPMDQKHKNFPREWPLGFDNDDNDDEDDDNTTSFCIDESRLTTESASNVTSLGELTRELEMLGLHVVEKLARSMGFEKNPFGENGSGRPSSLMWVSLLEGDKTGKVYPYVVALQYQIRAQKWSLGLDSGSVCVEPQVGSVLITVGDIAQVWSNGRLNKVRGRPCAVLEDGAKPTPRQVSMTMLLTLPLESTVCPILVAPTTSKETNAYYNAGYERGKEDGHDHLSSVEASNGNDTDEDDDGNEDRIVFNSFTFEDYAWRVYHERLHLKDHLDRYRRKLRN